MDHPLAPETVAVTAGRPPLEPDAPLNAPLTPASTYVAGGSMEYGRYGNPTWEAFEEVLGRLEAGRALTFASGLAAVSAIVDLIAPGEKIVVPRHAYLGVLTIMAEREQRGLLNVARVDVEDTEQVVAACDDAAIVWLESPTNPMLEVADIETIAAAGHEAGARVVVDNTFATPLVQRPLELGADIVLHSATKYLAGHSDAVLGAVVSRDDDVHTALDERRRTLGSVPGVLESWLAARGVRTLHLRLERSQANAAELAHRLEAHDATEKVRYPGFGSMIAIEVRGGAAAADLLTRSTSLWVHATSLGGVESTWERRRRWASEPETVPENLIRMSVGVENVDDLWRDLEAALGGLSG
ncbi:trans-sulfuration enzyme family protein [Solicola gregarius]|uniref:homocysteine desulfhydrase n=1 Tax=Solicola gregarius TaxID=2908642 RepID=A0AA46TI26_9ACTN|nr:aminotransferase class I/II-fold pyridoxal phosphate-dependent enzyme [Solicola gregarius]UYM05701.1 aminotransferase class I/II-fold pyridoxal phosphate-dependent enzyme [Solicola gregarius]